MVRKSALITSLLFVLILTACSSAPGPAAVSSPAADGPCPVGNWSLSDIDTYVRTIIPKDAFEKGTLKYDNATGKMVYSFTKDGQVSIQARQFTTHFKMTDQLGSMLLSVSIDGDTNGDYQLDGDKISVTNIQEGKLNYLATLEDTEMMQSKNPSEFAPLFLTSSEPVSFHCSGNQLSLEVPNMPEEAQAIKFTRISP
jgi:hypothetical protein